MVRRFTLTRLSCAKFYKIEIQGSGIIIRLQIYTLIDLQ